MWSLLWFTFGLLRRKHFNFSPGSALFSKKSHANTIRPQVEAQPECKDSWNQTQGLSLMTQTVPQAQHNLAHRTATIALPQHMQHVLRILNTQSAKASLGVLYVNLQ